MNGPRHAWAMLAALAAVSVPAAAAADDYLGAAACGACHAAILESWSRTAHARAAASLARDAASGGGRSGREGASARCGGCHMTGDAPAGRSRPGVGCEACHGPGADYAPDDVMRDPALARALGLRDLSTPARRAQVCMRCHRESTRLARFDPEAAWRRISHAAEDRP